MGKDHIYLTGFMGTGKSTVGRLLARRLGVDLVEMDARIVEEQGMTINEIFAKYGEARFREIESQLIEDLGCQSPCVVSCGGGAVIRPQNVENMKKTGSVVLLTALPETVYERVKADKDRPLLNGHMSVEYIAGMMAKRLPLYEAAADRKVSTDGKTAEAICEEILQGQNV